MNISKPQKAYVRTTDLTDVEGYRDASIPTISYYASLSPRINQGNMGGMYFHHDGSWRGYALGEGHWTDKSELIARLEGAGFSVVDETE